MATRRPKLAIELALGPRFHASARATGGHSIAVDLGLDPFLRIATALLLQSKFATKKVRRTYQDTPLLLRFSFDKRAILAGLKDPNIAHRLQAADVKIHRLKWEQGQLVLDVEKLGVGRAYLEASISVDEKAKVLIALLGQYSLPGGVWPNEISEVYSCVKTSRHRLTIDLRSMEGVGWSFAGTTARLTLILRLHQLLDFIHAH